jgi:hypothetical protein
MRGYERHATDLEDAAQDSPRLVAENLRDTALFIRFLAEMARDQRVKIDHLHMLIDVKDHALEHLVDEPPFTNNWDAAKRAAKAALELK